ncbi:MAG: hypothetical protein ABSD79_04830 [Dehalococcoidales bacterium]
MPKTNGLPVIGGPWQPQEVAFTLAGMQSKKKGLLEFYRSHFHEGRDMLTAIVEREFDICRGCGD